MPDQKLLSFARLQLHIDMPSIEETWLHGYESVKDDVEEDSNPYQEGTLEYSNWQEGWWAGFYGEEPLFNLAGDVNPTIMRSTRHPVVRPNTLLSHLSMKKVWDNIQNHHWYIRIWHVLSAILGYLIIYELMDLLVYVE